jgi:tetratricopeptide (TPR) repeat protein
MPSDQQEYEIFLSYARLDNRPIPETYPHGWVTSLRDQILADQRRYSTEPLRIFFDTHEIKDMDDWRHRILGGLRSSKVLLVCLSPSYFRSQPCRWEWDAYHQRQTHRLIGADSVARVYFVELPGSDEQENAEHLDELMRGNFTDLRPWFPSGAVAMREAEVQRRMEALGLSLWERIERARRARNVPGNVRRTNPFFVGRRRELRRLHEQLGVGAIGVVTAVHGLGGQGKTELAYHYANGYADCYPAGLWSLAAEGKRELQPLLGELAFVPQFGYTPSDAEKADATRLGQAVLEQLRKRCEARRAEPRKEPGDVGNAAALIILDNVSEAELLSVAQLATLPHPANWLRLVATTRLGPERLAKSSKQLATVAVDSLDEEDALTLIRDHQPDQRFPNATEESAAREIVREMGGFTLAVEQVAVHLGLNAVDELPSAFLTRLRQAGLPSVDELPADADVAAQMLHQQKQLGPILSSTLAPLVRELPAAETVLRFAALLPPDSVPWPWLRELATRHHLELADRPAEWGKLRRRLEGLRLLTSGDSPEIARLHRLVGAHLRGGVDKSQIEEVERYVLDHAAAIALSQTTPVGWELDAMLIALPFFGEKQCSSEELGRLLCLVGGDVAAKLKTYRSLIASKQLLSFTHRAVSRLAESDPGKVEWQRALSISLEDLGAIAVAQGDLTEARRLFLEDLRIVQRLAEGDPGNAEWQRDLAATLYKLGDVARTQGDLPEAQRLFSDSLRSFQCVTESHPSNTAWQLDMANCNASLGDLALAQGEWEEAKQYHLKGLEISQRLTDSDPGNVALQCDLARSLIKLGELAVAEGDLFEAQQLFADSLRIRQWLVETDANNATWQRDLAVSRCWVGRVEQELGELGAATSSYRAFRDTMQRLVESDPSNVEWQRDLAVSLSMLGNLAEQNGDLPEAQQFYTDSLRVTQRLAESDPGIPKWQRDLAVALERLGEVAMVQGDLPEAQRLLAEDLCITQRLAASDPENAEWQRDLWVSQFKMAKLLEQQGDAQAANYWRKTHDTLAAMVQAGHFVSPQDLLFLEHLQEKIGE